MVSRGGLGRGLGALIPSGQGTGGAHFREIPVDSIDPNPRQPRTEFEDDALAELVASISAVGLLQPVVVRESVAGRYQLVMGERRLRASRIAGLATIPSIVRDTSDDAMLRDALLENLHRSNLNPLEEAAAYQQLLDDFSVTHEELANRIGRSRPHVSNMLRLLGLPPALQRRVAAGVLTAGHARALLGLESPEAQLALATRIVAEGMSVRATEEAVQFSLPGKARRPRTPTVAPQLAADVAIALEARLDTRVRVDHGRRKGRIVIEYGSTEDLERIAGLLAPLW